MSRFFLNKTVRLLLSVSVSIWMAGGCLFGCTTGAMGAEPAQETDGSSCHAMSSHGSSHGPSHEASFVPIARGMMSDCPLGVNATAATSKSSAHVPEPGRVPVQALPDFEIQTETEYPRVVPFLHNRGSTHLQCCVFLI